MATSSFSKEFQIKDDAAADAMLKAMEKASVFQAYQQKQLF